MNAVRKEIWYVLCSSSLGMKKTCRSACRKTPIGTLVCGLLVAAIITVWQLPGPRNSWAMGTGERNLFTVTEGNYINPLLSSARTVSMLNCASPQLTRFAGYNDFFTRVDINEQARLLKATRYAGNLMGLLNIRFKLAAPISRGAPVIYIGERLWTEAFNRREDILGREITVHHVTYKILGVVRDFSGLLAETDLWIPVTARGVYGSMPCLRIVAALQAGADLKTAQRELSRCFATLVQDQAYSESEGARLLRMENSVQFKDSPQTTDNWIDRATI